MFDSIADNIADQKDLRVYIRLGKLSLETLKIDFRSNIFQFSLS
jgi:hypothetical protein